MSSRTKRQRTSNQNSFAPLADDGDSHTPHPAELETTPQQVAPHPSGPHRDPQDEEDEPSELKPLTATPNAPHPNLTQSNLRSFVQQRPRTNDPSKPASAKPNPKPPMFEFGKPTERPQLSQSNDRLKYIHDALKDDLGRERNGQPSEKLRGKKRRTEGEEEERGQTANLDASTYAWGANQPSQPQVKRDDDDESMYASDDPGSYDTPQRGQKAPKQRRWSPRLTPESPTKPLPRKRIMRPSVPKPVNPFAKFKATTHTPGTGATTSPYVNPPPKGFPPHSTNPVEAFKYCTKASKDRKERIKGGTATIFIVGDGRISSPNDLAQRIGLLEMTIKDIIKDPTADPHITPMEVDVNKPDGTGTYQHKVIQPWIISNLTSTALATLTSQTYWSREEITIGVFPQDMPIPRYSLTLWETTLLKADKAAEDKMATQVKSVLRSCEDFRTFVTAYDDRRPDHMGAEDFFDYTVDSARVRSLEIEHNAAPMIILLVDIESPTDDADEWDKACQGLRHLDWTGTHCSTVKARIHDYHCGFCKGLDHPTPQCPLPALGIHPNTIDNNTTSNPQQRQPTATEDEKVNPFGTSTVQHPKGLAPGKSAIPKHSDMVRHTGSRNTHNDAPRPLPPSHPYPTYRPYPYHPYPAPRHMNDHENTAAPDAGQPRPSTSQGRGRGGRRNDNNTQQQEWQVPQWPQYQQNTSYHHPYPMPPPPQPPFHPHYYSDYQY